jgi:hypothetical protein
MCSTTLEFISEVISILDVSAGTNYISKAETYCPYKTFHMILELNMFNLPKTADTALNGGIGTAQSILRHMTEKASSAYC